MLRIFVIDAMLFVANLAVAVLLVSPVLTSAIPCMPAAVRAGRREYALRGSDDASGPT